MRSVFPRVQLPIAEGGSAPMDRNWLRWARELWETMGWSSSVPVFDELYIGGDQMMESAGDTSAVTIDGDLSAPQLRDGQTDGRIGTVRLPNTYLDGSDVIPFVEIIPTTTDAGDLILELSYAVAANGSVMSEATEEITVTMPGVDNQVTRASFTAIDGDGLVKGSVIKLRLVRLGGDGDDDYGATAGLLGVGVKHQIEGLGQEVAHP